MTVGLLGATLALASCQTKVGSPVTGPSAPTFKLDAASIVRNLASKPSRAWQDTMMTYPPLRAQLKARQASHRRLLASSVGWSANLGSASSNAPVYAMQDPWYNGPNPLPNDFLYTLADNGTVTKFNPATGAVIGTPGSMPGTYTNSALSISGDSKRLYGFNTAGTFTILDAKTLTQTYSASISASGFANLAPFIDYGQSTGGSVGVIENVYAVSRDGSVYHLLVDGSTSPPTVTVNACPSSTGSDKGSPKATWSTNNQLALPAASTVTGFPVAWKGHVYYGTGNGSTNVGTFYDVDMSSPTAPSLAHSWNLAAYTTATGAGRAITAPAAMDFDDNFDVNAVFVPCGDRVDWIDPVNNTVTASASLTIDHAGTVSGAPANPAFGPLSGTNAVNRTPHTYTADWVSIKTAGLPNPTRWGGALPVLGGNVSCTSVRLDATGNVWVCNYSTKSVTIYRTNGTTTVVALSGHPTKMEFDGLGNAWVAVDGYYTYTGNSGGTVGGVEKITPAGVRVTAGFPVTFNGAVYVAPDNTGKCWVSDPFNRPGTGSANAIGSSGNAGRVQCILADGSFAFKQPIAIQGAATMWNDPNNVAWIEPYGGTAIYRFSTPANTPLQNPPAVPTPITVGGSTPIGIAFRTSVTPNEAWVCLNGSNKIQVFNMSTGASLRTLASSPNTPWEIRFAADGTPWTANTTLSGGTQTVTELNPTTGAVVNSYSMSSYGNPFELVLDASDTVYVACCTPNFSSGALVNIPNLGNTGDLFASSYRATAGDGDSSLGYLDFKITKGSYANVPVTDAKLQLTQNGTPGAVTPQDALEYYLCSAYQGGGTTAWGGYVGGASPNVDWGNKPNAANAPFLSVSGVAPGPNNPYSALVPHPADQVNTNDPSYAHFALGVRSTNKPLKDVIHWYTGTTNGGTSGYLPTLTVNTNSYAQLPTANGITCQPTIDATTKHLYLVASNAMIDLNYNNQGLFQMPSSTYYDLTKAGSATGYGPVNTGASPKTFIHPVGNAILTFNGRVVVPDYNPTGAPNNQLYLNEYSTTASPNSERLLNSLDVSPGKGKTAPQMLADYDGGAVYLVTSNNLVIRAQVLQ